MSDEIPVVHLEEGGSNDNMDPPRLTEPAEVTFVPFSFSFFNFKNLI